MLTPQKTAAKGLVPLHCPVGLAGGGPAESKKPLLALVGGPDIHSRIPLARVLAQRFAVIFIGSSTAAGAAIEQAGFEWHCYPVVRSMNPAQVLRAFAAQWRILRATRPLLVHTFDTVPCVIGRLAAWAAGVPWIFGTLPGLGSLYTSTSATVVVVRPLYQVLQKLSSTISAQTTFQNTADMEEFVRRGVVPRSKCRLIPGSGVDIEKFRPDRTDRFSRSRIRRAVGASDETVLVTCVSRLIKSKGLLELAEATVTARKTNENVKVLVVGTPAVGSPEAMSEAEIKDLRSAVTLVGPRDDIVEILSSSDLFVLPTYYREGIPRVLLEAAACGLPIITTNWPGCREVVRDGVNGLLVPPRDPEALAKAILLLTRDRYLRVKFGREGRRIVVGEFSIQRIAEQTAEMYLEALRCRK